MNIKVFFNNHKNLILFIIFVLIGCLVSLHNGMNWDFDIKNYHFYNPYAFLTGRVGHDFMPASIQSYYNPLLDIPWYIYAKNFNDHPKIFLFIFGLSYGLLIFFTYKAAEIIFKENKYKIQFSLLCTLVGSTALAAILQAGCQAHDMFVAMSIICGIWLMLRAFDKNSLKMVLLSGFILGCICGLKYTAVPFVFSFLFCIMCFPNLFKNLGFKKAIGLFFLLGCAGFLFTNGFWMYKLYTTFGNPTMPYFNEYFHNVWINDAISISDSDIATYIGKRTLIQNLLIPFSVKNDYRFIAIVVIFFINVILKIKPYNKEFEEQYKVNTYYSDLILLFSIIATISVSQLFPINRYLITISSVAGIIIPIYVLKYSYMLINNFEQISNSIKEKFTYFVVIITCLFFIFSIDYISEVKRLNLVHNAKKVVFAQDMNLPDDALVIAVPATGYTIPFQNPKAKFVFLNEFRFRRAKINILSDKGYEMISKMVKEQPQKIYILTSVKMDKNHSNTSNYTKFERAEYQYYKIIKYELKRYGINDLSNIVCDTMKTNNASVYICKIKCN